VACRTRNEADRYGAVRHSALRGSAARCGERRRSGLRRKELRGNAPRGNELRGNGTQPTRLAIVRPDGYGENYVRPVPRRSSLRNNSS